MDLLCDNSYLWAGRACGAITAAWTDCTHGTQLILQESVLTQHFELKQELYNNATLANMTCTLQMGQSEGGTVTSHPDNKMITVHSIKHSIYIYTSMFITYKLYTITFVNGDADKIFIAAVKSLTATWHSRRSASRELRSWKENATVGRLGVAGKSSKWIRVSTSPKHWQNVKLMLC